MLSDRIALQVAGVDPEAAAARELMVTRQLEERGIRDFGVLAAMREVPRELFVPPRLRQFAYADSALPIEAGQTISQPYIVALMAQAASIEPGDRVLEVGAGSGYAAAVLSRMASFVCAIEQHAELVSLARERFELLDYHNIELRTGDGTRGWPDDLKFDAILTAAGAPGVPAPLLEQLAVGGRLVIPIGREPGRQHLMRIARTRHGFADEDLGEVVFVPLVGAGGWADERPRSAG
jgi:protein-L-isoaspartate(D-aspartate) O-methyltransferase